MVNLSGGLGLFCPKVDLCVYDGCDSHWSRSPSDSKRTLLFMPIVVGDGYPKGEGVSSEPTFFST